MIDDTLSPAQQELLESEPLASASDIRSTTVDYDADGAPLEGYLAWDAAVDGPRPAVLIFPEWTGAGPNTVMRAQMLARRGYVAMIGGIYDRDVHPTGDAAGAEAGKYYGDLEAMRARAAAGLAQLAADERVDADRIVAIGYCFGGSAALELARTGARLAGVGSFHGRLLVHDPSDADAIGAPLLVMTGGADPVVPDDQIAAWQDELRAVPSLSWEVDTYAGAPHAFTHAGAESFRPLADARSWARFRDFLVEVTD